MDERSGALAGARGGAPVAMAPAGGLSAAEAAERLARFGPNELPRARRTPLWRMVADQVRDPLVMVLLVAAVLTLATGDLTDAGVIVLVIVVNTAAGVTQEVKAGQAIAALSELTAPDARVLRDGAQRTVPAAEVVPGDLLVLAEGDIVPADADVTDAAALLVDESALTGESVPADKAAGRHAVSAGTTVVRGRGQAVVTATGSASAMGRIAALMGGRQGLTPLQRRLAGVGRVLAAGAVVLSAVVLAIGLVRGQGAELMVVTAISLVVAAVPESLPAVVTLALALGARRMSARNALIRRLPAVETLGSVTVLGTDKTGTLTEGNMVVRRLWTPDGGDAGIDGTGYGPDGGLTRSGRPLDPGRAPELIRLLTAGALCNDAALRPPEGDQQAWTAVGDPTEAALLAAAVRAGLDPGELSGRFPRVAEVPFDSGRRRMTTAHRLPDGVRVICKGAPEVMLTPEIIACDTAALARAAGQAEDLARGGFRVLAVAEADQPDLPGAAGMERGLRLLGLTATLDPPRPAAAATIASCQAAGITPVLITGDPPATAGAIALDLGIIRSGRKLSTVARTGTRQPSARRGCSPAPPPSRSSPSSRPASSRQRGRHDRRRSRRRAGPAPRGHRGRHGQAGHRGRPPGRPPGPRRRRPRHRRRRRRGRPAGLRKHPPVPALRPCRGQRRDHGHARRAPRRPGAAAAPARSCGSTCSPTAARRRAGQRARRPSRDAPPAAPAESVLGAGLWQRIVRVGLVIAAVTLGVALWGHATGRPWQSMAFFALGTTQLAVALGSRARPGALANPALLWAVAGALGLQFAGIYLPFLN